MCDFRYFVSEQVHGDRRVPIGEMVEGMTRGEVRPIRSVRV